MRQNMQTDSQKKKQMRWEGGKMARKSRKNAGMTAQAPATGIYRYRTAIYVRLSVENSGKDDDGEIGRASCRERV